MNNEVGLYVVRVTFHDRFGTFYAIRSLWDERGAILPENMRNYVAPADIALALWREVLDRNDKSISTVSVVKLSSFRPYPEVSVLEYRALA